jgi:hypothetical protein
MTIHRSGIPRLKDQVEAHKLGNKFNFLININY